MMFFISSGKLLGSESISVDVQRFRNAFKATEKLNYYNNTKSDSLKCYHQYKI